MLLKKQLNDNDSKILFFLYISLILHTGVNKIKNLLKFDFRLKTEKKEGFLKRDPRMKERKKPGLKRARRGPQWSKR